MADDGRAGRLTITGGKQAPDVGYYSRLKEWQMDEDAHKQIAEDAGREFVPGEPPVPDPAGAPEGKRREPTVGATRLFEMKPTFLTLADRFLVPPFSVLDARAGYWQERKQAWLGLGIRGEVGRDAGLVGGWDDDAARKGIYDARAGMGDAVGRGAHLRKFSAEAEAVDTYSKRRAAAAQEETEAAIAATKGLDSAAGRGDRLLSNATPRAGYGGDYDLAKGENAWGGAGTSVFDPVLCELAYRWFSPPGGSVLDPFAGGSVRGIVAAALGRAYLGIDLRPEQVAANEQQCAAIGATHPFEHQPAWVTGDSMDLAEHVAGARYDFAFSCPPYFDLERYSDDPRDLSNAISYLQFQNAYRLIIEATVKALKDDRFACFVVGEVRGKDGHYIGLVPDTIRAFQTAGAQFYNEAILVTAVGSLPIRTSRTFPPGRKLGKTHQNILVFCKGDPQRAAKACGPIAEVALEYGGATAAASTPTPDDIQW